MSDLLSVALVDDFSPVFHIAALNVSEIIMLSAGILTASVVAWLGLVWLARKLINLRLKNQCWVSATAELVDRSIEVRPVSLLRRLGKVCKVARISYRYTYEVDGVAFNGAASVVEDIDIAYDPRVHAKRNLVNRQLPIRFLKSSPQISALNLSTRSARSRTSSYAKSPMNVWPLVLGCVGGLLFLFAGWRVISWKNMQHSPPSVLTPAVATPNPNTVRTRDGKTSKNMRSTISNKKSSPITTDSFAAKP